MSVETVPARRVMDELVDSGAMDDLFAKIDSGEVELTGANGLLPALLKETLERGLKAELTDHLGYEKGEPTARARGNARNGSSLKTIDLRSGRSRSRFPGIGPARSRPISSVKASVVWTGWIR